MQTLIALEDGPPELGIHAPNVNLSALGHLLTIMTLLIASFTLAFGLVLLVGGFERRIGRRLIIGGLIIIFVCLSLADRG